MWRRFPASSFIQPPGVALLLARHAADAVNNGSGQPPSPPETPRTLAGAWTPTGGSGKSGGGVSSVHTFAQALAQALVQTLAGWMISPAMAEAAATAGLER
jgi:hypothetical protein